MAHVILLQRVPKQRFARHITIWPQWPYDDEARSAKPVGDQRFRWPLGAPKEPQPGERMTEDEVAAFRKSIYPKIWQDWKSWFRIRAFEVFEVFEVFGFVSPILLGQSNDDGQDIVSRDWSMWERRFWELKERAIPYDEVAYTLLLHGYLLSHRHQSENAFLVLEEMKQAEIHPVPGLFMLFFSTFLDTKTCKVTRWAEGLLMCPNKWCYYSSAKW